MLKRGKCQNRVSWDQQYRLKRVYRKTIQVNWWACVTHSAIVFYALKSFIFPSVTKKKVVGVAPLSGICCFVTGTSSGSSSCRCTSFGELCCLCAGKSVSGRLSCRRAANGHGAVLHSWAPGHSHKWRANALTTPAVTASPSRCGWCGNTSPSPGTYFAQ